MIPKSVVKQFIRQPRKDYRWYKKLSTNELKHRCDALPKRPPIWDRLRQHQKACFLLGAKRRKFGFFLDMGLGKTMLSIALIRYFYRLGLVKRVLVLIPNKINKYEWAREIQKHAPKTKFCVLAGSSKDKWLQLLTTDALIVVETYAGLTRMVCTKIRRKNKNRLKPSRVLVKEMQSNIDGLILDESTFVSNHRALPFRICRQLEKTSNILFELTGTPFGRDPSLLWAQLFLLDKGKAIGSTLTLFREAFFTKSQNYWGGGFEYTFKKTKMSLLNRFIANSSIRYDADESDLPHVIESVKEVLLPQEAGVYVDRAKKTIIASKGNYLEMKNAFLRMRQISSGFLGYYDDENGSKAQYKFEQNPKLEMLLSLIQSIRPEHKIIVFHEYIFSGDTICQALDELEIGHTRLYRKTRDPNDVLRKFDHDPKCRVFVLNNSMGFGLNLQIARYGIYYESPVSPIIRVQTRRRFERQESKHRKVFMIDLVTRGTFDQRILTFLAQGEDLFKGIIKGEVKP